MGRVLVVRIGVNEPNLFINENQVGGYDDQHMETMLNQAFRYEQDN